MLAVADMCSQSKGVLHWPRQFLLSLHKSPAGDGFAMGCSFAKSLVKQQLISGWCQVVAVLVHKGPYFPYPYFISSCPFCCFASVTKTWLTDSV